MRASAPQCSFCLCRNPVHRVGSKCAPLMSKGMNVELDAQTFPLISHLLVADDTDLINYDGTAKPLFVHVRNKAASTDDSNTKDNPMDSQCAYICTLYDVHAADCLGTYIIPPTTIAEWITKSTCRVFISAPHEVKQSLLLSNPPTEKRKHAVSRALKDQINGHVLRLHTVWKKRDGDVEETWQDSGKKEMVMSKKRGKIHVLVG